MSDNINMPPATTLSSDFLFENQLIASFKLLVKH